MATKCNEVIIPYNEKETVSEMSNLLRIHEDDRRTMCFNNSFNLLRNQTRVPEKRIVITHNRLFCQAVFITYRQI